MLQRCADRPNREGWVGCVGIDQSRYGTHSLRRTKATLIYKRTKNIRGIQLLLGHTKLESTVRYLGIKVFDALEISEQTEIQFAARHLSRERMPNQRASRSRQMSRPA